MTPPIPVVLADPDPRTGQLLRTLLQAEADFEIVAETDNGREALGAIRRLRPAAAFVDVELQELSGLSVVTHLRHGEPPYSVLLADSADFAAKAFDAGAADYLLKPLGRADLGACLLRIRAAVRRWELCRFAATLLDFTREGPSTEHSRPPKPPQPANAARSQLR